MHLDPLVIILRLHFVEWNKTQTRTEPERPSKVGRFFKSPRFQLVNKHRHRQTLNPSRMVPALAVSRWWGHRGKLISAKKKKKKSSWEQIQYVSHPPNGMPVKNTEPENHHLLRLQIFPFSSFQKQPQHRHNKHLCDVKVKLLSALHTLSGSASYQGSFFFFFVSNSLKMLNELTVT